MSPQSPALTIDVGHQPDAHVIRIEGELDMAGCAAVESALQDAERSQAERIVVDLDGLEFINARGLQILAWASRRSASNGSRLRVTRGRGEVARMFSLTMLDLTLPFTEPADPHAPGSNGESVSLVSAKPEESLSAECLRLQDEARLARQRLQLYRGRAYGPRFTDPDRLTQLEDAFLMAENRLRVTNPAAPRMQQ